MTDPITNARSAYLDNAKGILITLVVFSHVMWEAGLHKMPGWSSFYLLIFAFHMPAFAFVSGYLTRSMPLASYRLKAAARLLAVYMVFQILHNLVRYSMSGVVDDKRLFFIYPAFTLWWLVSLAVWRLAIPLFSKGDSTRDAVLSILAALGVAVLSGYLITDGYWLTISRTGYFLPFFVAGHRASRHGWKIRMGPPARALSVGLLALAWFTLSTFDSFPIFQWLIGARSYAQLGDVTLVSGIQRLAILLGSGTLVVAFMQLVPDKKLSITPLGRTSLSVYVWHGLLVYAGHEAGLFGPTKGSWLWAVTITAMLVLATGFGPLAEATSRALQGRRATPSPEQSQDDTSVEHSITT
jgi:fucose 4-O-acetylase-like acetyltransferase